LAWRIPWRESGSWLVGDTHMHYRNVGLDRLAAESARHCDFIAVTSHAHRTDFFSAQAELIARAREAMPELVIINGVEWNPPIGNHASVLAPGGPDAMPVLEGLVSRFDRRAAGAEDETAFFEALDFLADAGGTDYVRPTVILNHPCKSPVFGVEGLRRGMARGPALVGFSGGGGHSAQPALGGDGPANEWVAVVGGVYDSLLAETDAPRPVMIADSDFHTHVADGGADFWPGEFARSFIFCPERSEEGVFAGLRSGASYFILGPLLDSLEFNVRCEGHDAMLGECLDAQADGSVEVRLAMKGAEAVQGVELIGNPRGQAEVVARAAGRELERSGRDAVWQCEIPLGSRGFQIRARGYGTALKPVVDKAGVMWFYTSAVRVGPAGAEG